MGGNEIDQQQSANQITSGKNGDLPAGAFGSPINEETAEKFVLGLEQPEFHLGKRAPKHEHHAQAQTNDGQLQRGKELY